jgi:hypothetical protein
MKIALVLLVALAFCVAAVSADANTASVREER